MGLRSPGGSKWLELNGYEPGSRFGSAYVNGEESDHVAFECDDVAAAVAELEREGMEVVIRPGEIGSWNEAFVEDPKGIWVELLARKRGAASRE